MGLVPTSNTAGARPLSPLIVNADVDAAAAIAYAKLALAGAVLASDIAAGAGIPYSKLNLAASIIGTDVAANAAIAASKLAGFPNDVTKALLGDGTWAAPSGTGQKLAWVGSESQNTNAAWETANSAILVPFTIQVAQTIAGIWVAPGSTQSGNFDIGVCDSAGALKVSKGSTAQSTLTANTPSLVSIASTALAAGAYFLILSADNVTGTWAMAGGATALRLTQRKVASLFPISGPITIGATVPLTAINLAAPLT